MYRSLVVFCHFITVVSQAQPATDIYLFDLTVNDDKIVISNAKNITNRPGYDNQPFFHPDQPQLYFVSADTEGRTDIFSYDMKDGSTSQITQTHDKEYSPTVTPDKKWLSCILQNDSGAQHLVKYPIGGGALQTLINNKIVGYHAWATENQVIMFTLPAPFKLELTNVTSGESITVDQEIGRSIHKIPGKNAVSYLKKVSETEWEVKMYDVTAQKSITLIKSLPGADHYMTWTPDHKIIMSEGNTLYFVDPKKSTSWTKLQTDESLPNKTITRIAVSPDNKKIALVISEE